ncbi:MAG TPA: hypothetical protein PKJ68_00280, partial [Candidatus Woesebacteria bacterium]|nr:hypothetical protein [Candidatus Woesebacteria bacterium]
MRSGEPDRPTHIYQLISVVTPSYEPPAGFVQLAVCECNEHYLPVYPAKQYAKRGTRSTNSYLP